MSKQNRSTLKNTFSSGHVASQSAFEDLIDSMLNPADENVSTQVGFTMISNNITNATATPYTWAGE